MRKTNFRANASEINKMPREVRYVWIAEYPDGSVTSCASYRAVSEIKGAALKRLTVLDLYSDSVLHMEDNIQQRLDVLLPIWREQYFNYEWDIDIGDFEVKS